MEDSLSTIFTIEQKQDSAEKLLAVADKETKYILFAPEFNTAVDQVVQNTIDSINIDFYWNRPDMVNLFIDKYFTIKKHLLGIKINNEAIFANGQVYLFIDRYKPKRVIRSSEGKIKKSGYKHPIHASEDYPQRQTEILLNSTNQMLDFGQEFFFKKHFDWQGTFTGPRANGLMAKATNQNNTQAQVYLQFRLKWVLNGKEYYSKPLKRLRMIFSMLPINGNVISYKL